MTNLSIIIPHYNSPKTLNVLLNSIPKNKKIQIIVIDDKSNMYLEEFERLRASDKYKHIKFVENTTLKKGAGVCRNIGMTHAEGKWILFADADDYFTINFTEKLKKYFESDYEVVFFTPTSIELDTGKISNRHTGYKKIIDNYINYRNMKTETQLRFKFSSPCSKLINRDFISKNNIYFDETIASNDVMFSTKIGFFMGKFITSSEIIYCITRSKGTLTRNMSEHIFNDRLEVFINRHNFLKDKLTLEEFNSLNIIGREYINKAIKYRLGFKKVLCTYSNLKKNGIKVFESKLLNPIYLIDRLIYKRKTRNDDNRYYIK